MKKALKTGLLILLVLVLLFLAFLALWVFILFPRFFAPKIQPEEDLETPFAIAEESEKISMNPENGVLYVNNEVIVFLKDTADEGKINALFQDYDATVDDTMADLFIYRLLFPGTMEYEELEAVIAGLERNPIVDYAYINPVTPLESDAEDDFQSKSPLYPDDPWKNVNWNTQVPRGSNWGIEAIDAPGAWGYLSQMSTVNVGLIDTEPARSHQDLKDGFVDSYSLLLDMENGSVSRIQSAITPDSHGTHVSGTINAGWNNHEGVSGVMGGKGRLYHSALYLLKKGKIQDGYVTGYTYLLCLKKLIDQDVRAINISQNTSRLLGFAASHGNNNAIGYLTLQANLAQRGLAKIVEAREKAGKPDFVICIAAGNSNSTYYYKDDKATYGYREEISFWESIKYLFGWRGEIGNSMALYNNFLNLMDDATVKDRVIVVGSVGIDEKASTARQTRYRYSYFSNVGSRVDIVAPGEDIYSCIPGGYGLMSGTSMAAPHVTGVAGLVFASNPSLTGPEVKQILRLSATGRYYHGNSYSGLLNANQAVVSALKTVKKPVSRVLRTEVDDGLDLCFVVDTTGSMGDDIQNAKENMTRILEHLGEKTQNYRVGLIDYRDYPSRTLKSSDYPYKVLLKFTADNKAIIDAINGLNLGDGGDNAETVYSALMAAARMDWRENAKKVIIILGDAPPLDPEPVTNYTYQDVILKLAHSDIGIDLENSDTEATEKLRDGFINVFSIGTDASNEAKDFFQQISSGTGGIYSDVHDSAQVSDAIISSIEQIEVVDTVTVDAAFGDSLAGQKINFYSDGDYQFSVETDENGGCLLESMPRGTYQWTCDSLYSGGDIVVQENHQNVAARMTTDYWFAPLIQLWYRHPVLILLGLLGYCCLCLSLPIVLDKCITGVNCWRANGRRNGKAVQSSSVQTGKGSGEDSFPSGGDVQICPNCEKQNPKGSRFCQYCGHGLKKPQTEAGPGLCKKCGHPYGPKDKFCTACGEIIRRS